MSDLLSILAARPALVALLSALLTFVSLLALLASSPRACRESHTSASSRDPATTTVEAVVVAITVVVCGKGGGTS